MTAEGVRSITVGSTQLRVAVRPGQPGPGASAGIISSIGEPRNMPVSALARMVG